MERPPEHHQGYGWLLAVGLALLSLPVGILLAIVEAPERFLFLRFLGGALVFLALGAAAVYVYIAAAGRRIAGGVWPRRFLTLTGIALLGFPVSAVLHNVISGLAGVEEPVFFLLAVVVSPLAILIGAIGAMVSAALSARPRFRRS